MRPSQKLNIGEGSSGEADAEDAKRAIAKARTVIMTFHMPGMMR